MADDNQMGIRSMKNMKVQLKNSPLTKMLTSDPISKSISIMPRPVSVAQSRWSIDSQQNAYSPPSKKIKH